MVTGATIDIALAAKPSKALNVGMFPVILTVLNRNSNRGYHNPDYNSYYPIEDC